ncbi:DUF5696 domain-containing protein [Paenibacillus sp. LHD-117]|uniref:DUF5696 domain-containing protein n=1 Tax=Paenibacillus sp. LHD-117 TaxID=3071412 RepID=UPI0027E13274|nr:DUF5696 domain-containing protein [Paenibacillus sp. LHD-117]MDQ6417870.1 DUF5696 domain-containing protein [Paenibacillus sp. LHD-117]
MQIARLSVLAAFAIAALVFTGCSDSSNSSASDDSVIEAFVKGKALSASFSDPRLSSMKGIVENEQLRLFVEETSGVIAILDKRSGQIWYSNPPERESDSNAAGVNKDLLSAQMKIDYYNNFGQMNSINSYTDGVVHKQIAFEELQNGVKVSYQFGKDEVSAYDLPKMLSAERFEQLSDKLDNTGKRAIKLAYRLDKETSIYQRNDSVLQGIQLNRAIQAFEDAGYSEEDLEQDMAELNFVQDKPAPTVFRASIEYMLDGDSLVVKVPVSELQYPEEYPVNMISFMNFFGAGGPEQSGSIFVPDGSGALIHFNNGKNKYPAYQQSVFGQDLAMNAIEDGVREQQVRLPVFGMMKEGGAFLGIIEEGASVSTISADIGGRLNSYNYVYPSFYVINKGQLTLNAGGQERSLPMFQENVMSTDYQVRYAFLNGDDASYSGMARYYRDYLQSSNGLPQSDPERNAEDLPFYMQLIGSISTKKHFAGIPYKALEPLTTFEQAKEILEQAKSRNINNIKLKYSGWFNGGLDHEVPDKISVDRAIGGSKGLRNFASYTQSQGISLFPDVALLIANTGDGFDEKNDASRTLRDVPADVYPLNLAINRRDRSKSPSYAISPRLVGKYTEDMLNDFDEYETDGISLRDLADKLNSDFLKNKQIDRAESERLSIQSLKQIHEEGHEIMADGGNAYALPYVTDLTNVPVSNSGFKIEDEAIPFYQMVIHGLIGYTGAPYNLSSFTDERDYVLKSLEYGSGVHFEWIYEPNYKVKDTEYNQLYAVNYELWIDKAAEIYSQINETLKGVRNDPIIGHEKLADGVYKTVYGNGDYVIVNYNEEAVRIDGSTVEAKSYLTGGERS